MDIVTRKAYTKLQMLPTDCIGVPTLLENFLRSTLLYASTFIGNINLLIVHCATSAESCQLCMWAGYHTGEASATWSPSA